MNQQFQTILQEAIENFQMGNLEVADSKLQALLKIDPQSLPALHILGLLKASQLKHKEAADLLRRAVKLNPIDASIHYNLAKALLEAGLETESLVHHKKAVELAPQNPDAWLNFGKCEFNLGNYVSAISLYKKALEIKPNYQEGLINTGAAYKELKNYSEALVYVNKALELNPHSSMAWLNKGVALKELCKHEDAIAAYEKAIGLNPNYPEAWSNIGNTFAEIKRYEDAIAAYEKAIGLNPNYPEAWSNKASALTELKRYEDAIAAYEKAIQLKPKHNSFLSNLVHVKMIIACWNNVNNIIQLLINNTNDSQQIGLPFPLLSIADNPSFHFDATMLFCKTRFPEIKTTIKSSKRAHQKIRIGYFSPDFRSHPVSYLTSELFELHDRSSFEIFAFSLQSASPDDPVRERLIRGFDHFIHVENKSDQEIAQLARDLEIDIAVDLAGYTQDSRMGIFAHRASPIQISYLGYPGTLGAPYIDYIVGDKTLIPEESRQFYTEKVVYLPNTYMVDDSQRQPSSCPITRKSANLPDDQFVFCCFNNSYKFNRETLTSWAFILLNVEKSVLWISENNEPFRKNLLLEFSKLGVASERIIFAKRMESMADHLSRYSLADLFLDTLPFNAHTTAVDSLKAGLPVLTLLGNAFAGRVAASLLTAIEMPELITTSRSEYQSLAVDLAKNPAKLIAIKEKLEKNKASTALFNTEMFTRHLEKAYFEIFKRCQKNLPPETIYITN